MVDFIDDVWRDLDRWSRMGARPLELLAEPGAWAVFTYRLGRALRSLPRPLRVPLLALHSPLQAAVRALSGVTLPLEAEIGGGLWLAHTGGVKVSPAARLGRDCTLSRGAQILAGRRDAELGAPFLGDRVYVGPGARVRGPIRIGNDAAVGAHAVAEADLPDRGLLGSEPMPALMAGRRRPPLAAQLRGAVRSLLPRPTQLLLREA